MMASSKRSDVWQYFAKVDNKPKVVCNLCLTELSYTGGSTGSMGNHLKLKHKSLKTESGEKLMNAYKKPVITTMQRDKWIRCTKSLALMCARDLRPISMCEGAGFRKFCSELNPTYEVPGKTCVSKNMTCEYQEKSNLLREKLKSQVGVAFSTDHWSSMHMQGFITMTAHFLDANWNCQNFVLAMREVSERYTGENTALEIKSFIQEFEISDSQISGIVTDNASNMVVCGENLEMPHLRCFAHTLQLSIKGAFDSVRSITKVINGARQLVKHFRKSVVVSNELRSRQKQMDIPNNALKIDCPTRWNSTYEMIDRLLEQRLAVYAVLHDPKVTKLDVARSLELSDDNWRVVEALIPVLKPLYLATRVMCSEEYPTLSGIYPIVFSLTTNHLRGNDTDMKAIADFKKIVADDITRRFHSTDDDYICSSVAMRCTFLDPRYRTLKFLTDDQRTRFLTELSEYLGQGNDEDEKTNNETMTEENEIPSKKKKHNIHDDMMYLLGDFMEVTDTDCCEIKTSSVEDEIDLYKKEKPVSVNTNPFQWWKKNECVYPKLAAYARKVLCIPATSVPSERVFSTAGGTVTKLRSSLESSAIDHLIFLHKYMKNQEKLRFQHAIA